MDADLFPPLTTDAGRWTTMGYRLLPLAILLLGLGLGLSPAAAQTPAPDALTLFVRRNFGYGGGSQIQGSFRFEIQGPADLAEVTYRIDQTVVSTTVTAPFRVDFQTDDYPLGWHTLTAEARTTDGRALAAAPRQFEFVSASAGWEAAGRIGGTMLAVVLGAMLVVSVLIRLPEWLGQRRPAPAGQPQDYGLLGGAICPRCGRPYPRHFWALNISLVGKFDRCDHCGHWALTHRASPEALRAAERAAAAADQPPAGPPSTPPPADQLRKEVDDSRYVD